MSRLSVVIPASLLLFSVSLSSSAQSFSDSDSVGVAEPPHVAAVPQSQMSTAQLPPAADPSVITVRPELTDEQLGDLYMVRKQYREAAILFKRLSDASPRNAVYWNKLGISLHQQAA